MKKKRKFWYFEKKLKIILGGIAEIVLMAGGIMQLGIFTEKPVIFGVLTPNDEQQALDRAGGKHGNKGVEAAMTTIKMVDVARQIKKEDRKIGF